MALNPPGSLLIVVPRDLHPLAFRNLTFIWNLNFDIWNWVYPIVWNRTEEATAATDRGWLSW
jgi:hypothetical protein